MLPIGASIMLDPEKIEKVSSIGLSHVELGFPAPDGGTSISEALSSAKRALRTHGVEPVSCHAPTGDLFDIGNFDIEARKAVLKRHKEYIERCAFIGSTFYVIHPGFENYLNVVGGGWDDIKKVAEFPREPETLERLWKTNVLSLRELADFAATCGVRVTLETGPPNMTTPEEILMMVRDTDRKNLGICVDTGHVNVGGSYGPANVIREFGPLVWTLHLHDNHADGDFHLVPGRGTIDWKSVAEALKGISYRGVLNMEVAIQPGEDVRVMLKEGMMFLQRNSS